MIKKAKPKSVRTTEHEGREQWLKGLANGMSTWFVDLDFPVPKFEIRTGFPSAGIRSSNISESWKDDKTSSYVVYIRPDRGNAENVAAALAFQMCQIAVDGNDEHGLLFRHVAISIGLKGRKRESKPGRLFSELVKPILKKIGPLPSPDLELSNNLTKGGQTSRMKKVSCKECGYVARVSRKWLDMIGPPHCPKHGAMEVNDK